MKNISLRNRPDQFQAPLPVGPCVHHYVIETPAGETSPGICRNCGAEKQFKNWLTDSYFEVDYAKKYGS